LLPIFRTGENLLPTNGASAPRTSAEPSANGCALWGMAFLLWSIRNWLDVAVRASSAARGSRLRTHAWQRVSDHVSLAHLLSASASWWAIRGVIPIHSTGVPNARMT